MRIQTLAAAAVLSLAATIPLSTAAFADQEKPDCVKVGDLKAEVNGRHCLPDMSDRIFRSPTISTSRG